MSDAPFRACADCDAPLERGQRYCLDCGARSGSRSPELLELMARQQRSSRDGPRAIPATADAARPATPPPGGHRSPLQQALARLSKLPLPSRRIAALLVLGFLGFGVLLGNVAGSRVDGSFAASSRAPLKLLLPAAATKAAGSTSADALPPAASAEATPPAASELPEGSTPSAPADGAPGPSSHPSPAAAKPHAGANKIAPAGGGKGGSGGPAPGAAPGSKLPAVKHVFVIMLSDQPYAAVFGPASSAPYLSHTLEHQGALLVRYYAVAHEQLANGIALLSGQGPTPDTALNCPVYGDLTPATIGAEEQALGNGCVYTSATQTLAGQLTAKHLSWRAYVQGVDGPGSAVGACAHPSPGAPDPTSEQAPADAPYATFRDPFVYFHSVIDSPTCAADDVGLGNLSADLASAKSAPSFSYIVPDRCHDGEPGPCAGSSPGGLAAADGFLQQVVPEILRSPAYKHGGLLAITVDEAPSVGEFADSSSCCGQPRFPNLPAATGLAAALPAEGGGQVGALLLSPFVKGGTTSQEPYNHYSLLRTIEDLFGLGHLGYAGGAKVSSLEPSLFSAKPPG